MNKMTTTEMEVYLARFFKFASNLIVPNISWGLNLHECDLLILTDSGYATEVEIKISKSDLKKDKEKLHEHSSSRIKKFYFAIPETIIPIEFALEHIPERAGLIVVNSKGSCVIKRECIPIKNPEKFNERDRLKMARLGALRIWNLKEKVIKLRKENKLLKK